MTYLGLDIGTSAVKAVLVDEAQRPLALAEVPSEGHPPVVARGGEGLHGSST